MNRLTLRGVVKKAALAGVVAATVAAFGANAPVQRARLLYPSEAFELKTTPKDSPWPGRHVNAVRGAVDLSDASELRVEVSNRLSRPLAVMLSVKSRALQGRSPGDRVTLPPNAVRRLVCDLRPEPWRLDAPIEFIGMNGYPTANGEASGIFDVRGVTGFHLFMSKGEDPESFDVLRVAVRNGVEKPVTVYSATNFMPFVDRFGQFCHAEWPGKIHSDDELVAAEEEEAKWLAANAEGPDRARNKWGGWTDGPRLRATGFFRTEKVNGKWWLVDPDGRLFWSHGVDCVTTGGCETPVSGREGYFAWLPEAGSSPFGRFRGWQTWPAVRGYYAQTNHVPFSTFNFASANCVRKYGAEGKTDLIDLAHRRMRAWGLNTMGAWSSGEVYAARRTPYTLTLGTGGTPRRAKSKGWWGPLPDPENPAFERIFRERARAAARKMRDDPWCLGIFVDNELSWNDLPDLGYVAEVYYRTVARILKEELPNHLYLGSRIAWGTDEVYRAAARHCDVVSVNVYARDFNRDLPEGAEDKPMINGEFHFGALDRGMFHTGLVATRDQADRANRYRAYVRSCLDHPRMVGTHWFQWRDQPLTGRPMDGENYQIGFLTVTDAPYPELVEAAREVAKEMYARRWGE